MANITTQKTTYPLDFFQGRIAYEISNFVGAFRDGDQVVLKIDEYAYHLSPAKADLLAQGFLMAALRTGLRRFDMPWRNGQIHNVSAMPKKTFHKGVASGMGFRETTLYIPEADYKFFASGWLYEGVGEDLDFPANVVFLKTRRDGVVGFKKGNDEFLLSPKHVVQLCLELADSSSSLVTRVWSIWDRRIEWSTGDATSDKASFDLANKALFDCLKSYKPIA
ncbi:hypothetical protein I4N56_019585 [Pseudomonas mohnii]|uniref:hypothetical protein n=1 Tax=Pseudomonas mohnii TaxID=395600 RepID=UPI0018C5B09F|nr:hypothetical protein [Pseudomonas mohnii]MBH8612881.1 hypothetical protein [Pseudomonas mohnii]